MILRIATVPKAPDILYNYINENPFNFKIKRVEYKKVQNHANLLIIDTGYEWIIAIYWEIEIIFSI